MKTPVHPLGSSGRDLGRVETRSAIVSCTSYPASLELQFHAHERANLCAVLEGGLEEHWGRRGESIGVHQLLAKPGGAEHVDRFGIHGARCLNIDLSPSIADQYEGATSILREPCVVRDPRVALLAHGIESELAEPDELSALAIEADVLALVCLVSRTEAGRKGRGFPPWLRQARDLLNDRLGDAIGVAELAHEVGVSPGHLAKRFREGYRCSIADYVRRRRIEKAIGALHDPRLTMAEIAQRSGFCDQSHFCRVFKQVTGVTPGSYRRRIG